MARSGESGCPLGWAATPMEKPPMARASSTSSEAWANSPTPASGSVGRVAAEGHQVLHAGLAQVDQDLGQLEAGVGHADEVGHGDEVGGPQHPGDQVDGPLAATRRRRGR